MFRDDTNIPEGDRFVALTVIRPLDADGKADPNRSDLKEEAEWARMWGRDHLLAGGGRVAICKVIGYLDIKAEIEERPPRQVRHRSDAD